MIAREKSWKNFEKLVAAINRVEINGAIVNWNEIIDSRQFDVTVRFNAGLYKYLTVIECKDSKRKVEVKELEAFITKSNRVKANKAILVSRNGFQKACFSEAKIEGIDLYTLQEINLLPKDAIDLGFHPTIHCWDFNLIGENEIVKLPAHRNILPFLAKQTYFNMGDGEKVSLEFLLQHLNQKFLNNIASEERQCFDFPMKEKTVVSFPDVKSGNTLEKLSMPIKSMSFYYQIAPRKYISGTGLDPYLSTGGYQFKNAISEQSSNYYKNDLKLGINTKFKPNSFYKDVNSDFFYICHEVNDALVIMTLIEGYQHGKNLQVTFSFSIEQETNYIEINDREEILRLTAMVKSIERIGGPLNKNKKSKG